MTKKFEELKLTINMRQKGGGLADEEVLAIVKDNNGKLFMDEIRAELTTFINEEKLLLEARKGNYRESKAYITTLVTMELVFFVFLGVLTAFFIRNKFFSPIAMLLNSTLRMERGEKPSINELVPNDEMGYLLSRFYQMSEKVYQEAEQLTQKATHDDLTGIRNRSVFEAEFEKAVTSLASSNEKLAVLFIDLDNFKSLNDTLGHEAGDAVLIESANRIEKAIREEDIVFRFGGDEFVVLAKGILHASDATHIATNILEDIALPFSFRGKPLDISLSIGVALAPDDSTTSDEIMKFADVAMYAAKRSKDTHYQLFNSTMLQRQSDQ